MGTRVIVLLGILVAAALFCTAAANNGVSPNECCFGFYPKRVKIDLIKKYYHTDIRCGGKAGIIVVTQKKVRMCMDPALPWVQKMMRTVDERSF